MNTLRQTFPCPPARVWYGLVTVCIVLCMTFSVRAQRATLSQIAVIPNQAVTALALTGNGRWLFIADASAGRFYDLARASSPRLNNRLTLEGDAFTASATETFFFAAIDTPEGSLLQVLQRPTYNRRQGFITYGVYDLPAPPRGITISPDNQRGMVYGDAGYILLEIVSGDEINSSAYPDDPVISAALSDSRLFIAHDNNSNALQSYEMSNWAQSSDPATVDLGANARQIVISDSSATGAALLDTTNSIVTLFDTQTLETYPPFAVDFAVRHLRFSDNVLILVSDTRLFALDIGTPDSPRVIAQTDIGIEPLFVASGGDLLAISDGSQVILFRVSA